MADQNLDILIRILTEGVDKATAEVAKLKAELSKGFESKEQLDMFRGVVEGMEQEIAAINKRKMAVVEAAHGAKAQAEAAKVEAAIRQEIKALDDFEKAKAKQIAAFQKGEADFVEAMARGREASERKRAAGRAEMEQAQQAAVAAAAQAKGKQELAERTKEVARAETERKDKLADAIRANATDEETTKKGTKAKQDYREALKGIALDLPHVGQGLRLLTSPMALLGAAAGASIQQIATLLQHIDELEAATRNFSTRNDRIDPMSVIRENTQRDRDAVRQQIAGLDEISRQAQQAKLALESRGGLAAREAEVKLAERLEQIQGALARGEIKEADAIRQRTAALRDAREATEQAALVQLERQAAQERLDASRQAFKATKEEDAANALTPLIEKQIDATNKAQTDVGDVATANAPKRKLLEEQRAWLMEAVSSPNIAKLDFLRYAQIRFQSGKERARFQDVWSSEGAAKELENVEAEIAGLNQAEASAKKLAAQEERKLAKLKADQSRHDSNAQRHRSNAEAATDRAEDIQFRHSQEEAGIIERRPTIRRTEDMQMNRQIREIEERERQLQERNQGRPSGRLMEGGGSGSGGGFGGGNFGGLNEAASSTNHLTGTLDAFSEAVVSAQERTVILLENAIGRLNDLESRVDRNRPVG